MKKKSHTILGVSFGHDASAALIVDGQIVADVSEERFNRIKHSADYPIKSIEYCLSLVKKTIDEIDEIAVANLKQDDSFENVFGVSVDSFRKKENKKNITKSIIGFVSKTINDYYSEKITRTKEKTPTYLRKLFFRKKPKVTFVEHHLAHAACAYYTSNSQDKMVVATMDGVGDGFSSCIWLGEDGKITPLVKYDFRSSIGWFYSNVTEAIGWWHGDGEGKTMGLAPYGDYNKCKGKLDGFYPRFENGELVQAYDFPIPSMYKQGGCNHWHSNDTIKIEKIVRKYGKENVSAEAQRILEEQVMNFVLPWLKKVDTKTLATSGGVFTNVKLNQRIWMSGEVDNHFPYPNPGDSGLALGSALFIAAQRKVLKKKVYNHLYLGPEFSDKEIEDALKLRGLKYRKSKNPAKEAAKMLAENKIVSWFQGRMESGPRALGGRSILMSPKRAENKDIINAHVKFREAFRPFCPSMIDEAKSRYMVKPRSERYMVTSFDCPVESRHEIPAVVHVDGTIRPQTVTKKDNPKYWNVINEFGKLTGTPVLLNTSFNIRGEAIVCTPSDAIRCFYDGGIDMMVMGNFIVEK